MAEKVTLGYDREGRAYPELASSQQTNMQGWWAFERDRARSLVGKFSCKIFLDFGRFGRLDNDCAS